MVHNLQQRQNGTIIAAQFYPHSALATGRQRIANIHMLSNPLSKAETYEPGAGQNNGVILCLIELAQSGIDVTAQKLDIEVGTPGPQLTLTP